MGTQITNDPNSDYRNILVREFQSRQKSNPAYSLNAFSRDLKLSSSRLHEVLNGRYGLSRSAGEKIAKILRLDPDEQSYFCDLIESCHGRSKLNRKLAAGRLGRYRELYHQRREFKKLKLDTFKLMSEWYHFALIELTYLDKFQVNPSWISHALGITTREARSAISRLTRLNLLKFEHDQLLATEDFSSVGDETPSDAVKSFHRSILDKAKDSIKEKAIEEREISSVIFSFDSDRMQEAKECLRKFQKDFCTQFGDGRSKNSVYCLASQFFELTKKSKL